MSFPSEKLLLTDRMAKVFASKWNEKRKEQKQDSSQVKSHFSYKFKMNKISYKQQFTLTSDKGCLSSKQIIIVRSGIVESRRKTSGISSLSSVHGSFNPSIAKFNKVS